jgi:hypothetical protein
MQRQSLEEVAMQNSPTAETRTLVEPKERGESKMSKFGKYFLLATGFLLLASFARIPGATTNVHAKDQVCSVASLKGTYAFRRTCVNNVVGGPIAQIGINVLNGDGTIGLIRTTRSSNGVIEDWTDEPAPGSYTVDPDCTGSFFNKLNNLIVLDGGKRYFLLAVSPGTIVTEEGIRLEEEKDQC